jgi:hypothetical protein
VPTYSFGAESPVKFEISDKLANHYNEAVEQYFKAKQRFNQKFGRPWNPITEPIMIKWSKHQRKAWNKVAGIVNDYVAVNGPIYTGEYLDDYLIENKALEKAVEQMINASRPITLAVGLGVLYVLLRGL